jgi:hypothetical protein
MTKEITVTVRQDHIDDGEIENSSCCAIALACEDVLTELNIWNVDQRFEMSVDANAWISVRDASNGKTIYELQLDEDDEVACSRFIDRFDNQNEYYASIADRDQNLQPFEFTAKLVKEKDE